MYLYTYTFSKMENNLEVGISPDSSLYYQWSIIRYRLPLIIYMNKWIIPQAELKGLEECFPMHLEIDTLLNVGINLIITLVTVMMI